MDSSIDRTLAILTTMPLLQVLFLYWCLPRYLPISDLPISDLDEASITLRRVRSIELCSTEFQSCNLMTYLDVPLSNASVKLMCRNITDRSVVPPSCMTRFNPAHRPSQHLCISGINDEFRFSPVPDEHPSARRCRFRDPSRTRTGIHSFRGAFRT